MERLLSLAPAAGSGEEPGNSGRIWIEGGEEGIDSAEGEEGEEGREAEEGATGGDKEAEGEGREADGDGEDREAEGDDGRDAEEEERTE